MRKNYETKQRKKSVNSRGDENYRKYKQKTMNQGLICEWTFNHERKLSDKFGFTKFI